MIARERDCAEPGSRPRTASATASASGLAGVARWKRRWPATRALRASV